MTLPATDPDSRRALLGRLGLDLEAIAARDLVGLPVYLVASSQVPAAVRAYAPAHCEAWTSGWLGGLLEPWLRDRGTWRGPGAAIALVDDVPGFSWSPSAIAGLAVHELAHVALVAVACDNVSPVATVFARSAPATIEQAAAIDAEATAARPPKWLHHGSTWIRIVLHLSWRLTRRGYFVDQNTLCVAGAFYGLSPIRDYLLALNDEPAVRRNERLVKIARSPLPHAFAELWAADTADSENALRAAGCVARRPAPAPSRPGGKRESCSFSHS